MEIKERIEQDFKEALKKRDAIAISTFRMLKAAMHNKEIEKKGEKLQEVEVIKIINKQVQQHEDSIEQFTKGNRQELVEKEGKELEILKRYLPKQLSPEEIGEVASRVISEIDTKDKANFGQVMKLVMLELKGKADGRLVGQIVSAQLKH